MSLFATIRSEGRGSRQTKRSDSQPLLIRPRGRHTIPAVRVERLEQGWRQRALVARGDIRSDVRGLSHPRNHRAHLVITQYETKRELGKRHSGGKQLLECLRPVDARLEVLRNEVQPTPV